MIDEIALLIDMPEAEVEEKLEEGECLAVKVEILRVYEHDELFAQHVGIILPDGGTPSSAAAAERMLKGAIASIEEALKRLHADPEEGSIPAQKERAIIH